MKLTRLLIKNCRIFEKKEFEFEKNKIIFFGNNATGKTTILESIYLLSCTKSLRTNNLNEVIRSTEEFLIVEGEVFASAKQLFLLFSFSKDGKNVKKNHNQLSKISDYIGLFDAVFFQPSDTNYFSLSPQNRRSYFDASFCQVSKDYLVSLSLYKKLLKQRNLALKEAPNQNDRNTIVYLEILTKQLCEEGKKLINYRKDFVFIINEILSSIHFKFDDNEELNIIYKPDLEEDNMYSEIMNQIHLDFEHKHTRRGPHRDDYIFIINNKNIFSYCSQGQQKSAVLSFKIALLSLFKRIKNEWPVLILDDALGELDKKRQNALFKILDKDIQMFLSTTSLKGINDEILLDSQIIEINKGVDINE